MRISPSISPSSSRTSRASPRSAPVSPGPARPARLFPRRPHRALVGARLLDRRHGNLDAHHHRHARARLQRESGLSATGDRLPDRARDSMRGLYPPIFPGRILHGLPASRKAVWRAHGAGCRRGFSRDARPGRRSAHFRHRKGGERGAGNGRAIVGDDCRGAHDFLYIPGRDERRDLDGRNAVRALSRGLPGRVFSATAQNSRGLGRSGACCRGKRRKAARLRLCLQSYAKLHISGQAFSAGHS